MATSFKSAASTPRRFVAFRKRKHREASLREQQAMERQQAEVQVLRDMMITVQDDVLHGN